MQKLFSLPIAHRGLHGEGIPENSLAAFSKAVSLGYAVETDVRLTKDKKLILFHDDNLFRMTGKKQDASDLTLDEIRALTLKNSDQKIPLLQEFLSEIRGQVPILLEIKNISGDADPFLKSVAKAFEKYEGEWAMQSFNPLYVKKFKKLCPDTCCGVLTASHLTVSDFDRPFRRLKKAIVSKMKLNFLVKPDFVSFELHDPRKKAINFKGPKLCWTVRSFEEEKACRAYCDNIIFEGYTPQGEREKKESG